MGKKYIQQPAEKPGAMVLEELKEQEINNGDLVFNEDTQRYDRVMKMTPFLIKLLKEKALRKEVINKFKVKK